MRSLKARFCLSFALPFVLGLFFFFFFYVSSLFFLLLFLLTLLHFVFFFLQSFLLDPTSLVLSSLVLQRLQIYPGPEGGSLALGASASDRAEAKQPWPPRYLPSGINQLNARLLEASPSLKPILLAFLRLPILFPPADVFEGRPLSGRDLPIINSTRLSTPRTHTGHPPRWILLGAGSLRRRAPRARNSHDCEIPIAASRNFGIQRVTGAARRYPAMMGNYYPRPLFAPRIRNRESWLANKLADSVDFAGTKEEAELCRRGTMDEEESRK